MLIIPAIDLKDGKCVRLKQGDMDSATIFSDDPGATAKRWLDLGARRHHVFHGNGDFVLRVLRIVLARAFVVRRVMLWWLISRRLKCAVPPLVCGKRAVAESIIN